MIAKTFLIILCVTSFFYIFYVLRKLVYFLSDPNEDQKTLLLSIKGNYVVSKIIVIIFNIAARSMLNNVKIYLQMGI